MFTLESLLIGIFGSLIASFILYVVGLYARVIPPKLRGSFDKEYRNQKAAIKSILRDAQKSQGIKVFCLKGDTFSNPNDAGQLHSLLTKGPTKQQYLISSPQNPYIKQRAIELKNLNLDKGIENSIACFQEIASNNSNVNIVLHDEIVRFRLIIFDHCLYLSFQSTDIPGRKSPMQKYKRDSSGYLALEAYFNDLWSKYTNTLPCTSSKFNLNMDS